MLILKQIGRWIYVNNFNVIVDDLLYTKLSYIKKDARFMPNPEWAIVRLYKKKMHKFPIGLLERVKSILNEKNIKYVLDILSNQTSLKPVYGGLRTYQKCALDVMIQNTNGIIKMPCASGKTKVTIQFIKNINLPTLVLVPTIDLVKQWKAQVGKNTHVKTYMGIKNKSYLQQFQLIICDESHHVQCKTLQKIGMNIREDAYIFGLSATPFDGNEPLKVEAVLGSIIYEISIRELVEQGYLCDAKIHYHTISKMESDHFLTYPMVYEEYIVGNMERNREIIKIANQCTKPCLILVNRIDHGSLFYVMLKRMLMDVTFIHGNSKKKHREDTNHDIIIATSIYDEGIDLPNLKTLIIAAGGKSAIKATQRIGRLLRPSPGKPYAVIHDFKDACRWLCKHYRQRRKIFEKDFEVIDE